jgi:energy-coupling factor transporter ATP-binding protein EcfA2
MPFDGIHIPKLRLTLNEGQQRVIQELLASIRKREVRVLTGHAGSGKTTLIQALASLLLDIGISVILAGPTHQSVRVMRGKLAAAGLDVKCVTVASLLSLKPHYEADRMVFSRSKDAKPVQARAVIFDECSMLGESHMGWIEIVLPNATLIFVGDEAQLCPVGEKASRSFNATRKSHLDVIVRQTGDNPILDIADAIRKSQGGPMDWSWAKSAKSGTKGVFRPSDIDAWMKKAFLSPDFTKDASTFRYAAWTNRRIDTINQRVRGWIYGDDAMDQPFFPGERALVREPFIVDETPLLTTCEEVTVESIRAGFTQFSFDATLNTPAWDARIPVWETTVLNDEGLQIVAKIPRDDGLFETVLASLRKQAIIDRKRWDDFHKVRESIISLRNIYGMTVHSLQGSTIGNVFMDIPDIARRAKDNVLECQQLCYVAATRPSNGLILSM